jgi:hypothetical protein
LKIVLARAKAGWILQSASKNVTFKRRFMSRSILNLIAVAILIVGLGCVALIERNARIEDANAIEDNEATHALLHPEDYGSYTRSAETIGGKSGMLLSDALKATANLGHSRPFAVVIAIVSLIAATGIFTVSILPPRK